MDPQEQNLDMTIDKKNQYWGGRCDTIRHIELSIKKRYIDIFDRSITRGLAYSFDVYARCLLWLCFLLVSCTYRASELGNHSQLLRANKNFTQVNKTGSFFFFLHRFGNNQFTAKVVVDYKLIAVY